jgi:hypothetical protein
MNFHLREKIIRRAPLAVRCIDAVRRQPVSEDLHVEVYPRDNLTDPILAQESPISGIFGVRTLPGLREYITNERDADHYCTPKPPEDEHKEANFVLLIKDKQQRFLPATLLLCLPKTDILTVDLHSSPARTPIAGMASVYGELWDDSAGDDGEPASWAVVQVTPPNNNKVRAIADERGMFHLMLPHPAPKNSGVLHEMKWDIKCEVFYKPKDRRYASPRLPPDMRWILNQDQADIRDGAGGNGDGDKTIQRSLKYQASLVLRTQNEKRLLIKS